MGRFVLLSIVSRGAFKRNWNSIQIIGKQMPDLSIWHTNPLRRDRKCKQAFVFFLSFYVIFTQVSSHCMQNHLQTATIGKGKSKCK